MVPYIILVILPFMLSVVAFGGKKDKKGLLYLGKTEYIEENNVALPVFFLIYFLLLSLRDISIGNDIANYKYYFEYYDTSDIRIIFNMGLDIFYGLFNWLFQKISHNFQLFLAAVAAFCVFPVAKLYCKNRKNSMLQIAVFVNLSTFIILFSGLRQAMAMAVGFIAYEFVKKGKILPFIISCIVAIGFHHSAFMLFFMYPLYHISFKKKHLIFIVPAIAVCFIFNEQIFTFLANTAALFSDKYEDVSITQTGAITTFLMFAAFAVFCYIIPDEKKMTKEDFGLRNFLLFAVVLQSFSSLHMLAMRMNYYYMIFIPIIMARVIEVPKERYRQVAKFGGAVITALLLTYFFFTLYGEYKSGESTLNTVPYVAFWENQL